MDGAELALNQAIVVNRKSHLHFDGFQFRRYNYSPASTGDWLPRMGSEFNLNQSDHITITRCLSDGRGGGSTARTIISEEVEHLLVQNCVSTNKMGNALYLRNTRSARIENSVFLRPMISAFLLRHCDGEVVFENNIFTDSLRSKAESNIRLAGFDGGTPDLHMPNHMYFIRAFTPETRHVLNSRSAYDASQITDPYFGDPLFVGALELIEDGVTSSFMPDRMAGSGMDYDFEKFFATDAEAVSRGIGLQPDQFTDGLPN